MGKYLEIAQRALQEAPQECTEDRRTTENQLVTSYSSNLDAARVANTDGERSDICEISPVGDEELKEVLEDDWREVLADPAQLEVARRWVTEAKQVANGIIPERYTQTSDCKFCGPVFVYEGYPQQANNCPWCFNRIKGLPIPKKRILK